MRSRPIAAFALLTALLAIAGCGGEVQTLEVTAAAYTSHRGQTDGDPYEAAWNNRIEPGMKAIAVSRDLIAMGLDNGTEVEIEGLPGTYRVLDKMAARHRRRIDIYMGRDIDAAREWGVRKVQIRWRAE